MPFGSSLMRRLGMSHPVIQAPMAGGGDTPALVAAVSKAGGLGSLGAAYLTAEQILAGAAQVRRLTNRPFAINLFAPTPHPAPTDGTAAITALTPYFAELGLPAPSAPSLTTISFGEQLDAILESGAAAFSFTFAIPPADLLDLARAKGLVVVGTATTVGEAIALEAAGVDAVVAQGSEAGGHRGTFAGAFKASMIGTMALVPQVVDAVKIPVIASGGIMDGRGVAAGLALGASAVQMGTAFLTCDESGASAAFRAALLAGHEDETALTRAFSGRYARGIVNRVMREVGEEAILPFPLQNVLTRGMRTAAGKAGRSEFLSMWAGQGLRMARVQSAEELMRLLADETELALWRIS